MSYEKNYDCSNYNYDWQFLRLCNRCGVEFRRHPNSEKFDRECNNPRYLQNKTRTCGCKRTPVYEMALRQKAEGDPDARVDTHCCFCKRATKLINSRVIEVNNESHEQCYRCLNKIEIPEKEELFDYRRTQRKKSQKELSRKINTTPANEINILTEEPNYKPIEKLKEETPGWKKAEQKKRKQWCTKTLVK
jgi:hypothetical protein